MQKKLATALTELGLTVDGNRAHGVVKGYEVDMHIVRVAYGYTVKPWQFGFAFYATDAQKETMAAAMRNAAIKFCDFAMTSYGMTAGFTDITLGKFVGRLPALFDTILGIVEQNGGVGAGHCPVCGKEFAEDGHRQCDIDGVSVRIDNDCIQSINAAIAAENKDFVEAPNHYLRGFAGALIGGAAGVVVAIVLYLAGFYASLSAIVSVALGAFLYCKLGGKPNKQMIVIVSATTIVCMVLSVFLIYFIAAGNAARDAGLSISAAEAFKRVMQDDEVSRAFTIDMVMALLFSVIGIVGQVMYLSKSIRRKKEIK